MPQQTDMCVWVDAIFIRGIMFLCLRSTATAVMFLYLPSTAAAVGSARAAAPSLGGLHSNTMTASLRCKVAMQIGAAECDLNEPTTVCAYDRAEVEARFRDQPLDVAARLAQVGVAYAKIQMADDDGATLRAELGKLGPVFCKVGQTMATRPDIIGLETSRNLGKLQDAMAPEADGPAVAMKTLSDALGGDPSAFFTSISPEPVAAASLAEVYKGTTTDGVEVAIKIQRPGLERKVALDFYVLQQALALAQKQFKIGKDVEQIVAVLDEVGNGIFSELDFTIEAQNILRFERTYAAQLRNLGVVVPAVRQELSSARVLVTEWIDGVPPRDLEANARQALAKTAVRCLAMQLMTDGFIHCDPHEGNLLALPDGRVALLDFGLMASMQTNHQEAMAHGVLNIMAESKCCTHLIPVDPPLPPNSKSCPPFCGTERATILMHWLRLRVPRSIRRLRGAGRCVQGYGRSLDHCGRPPPSWHGGALLGGHPPMHDRRGGRGGRGS